MTRSVQQREAIKRRRLQAEAAKLREGPLRPTGPSAQLRELPGTTFEDIFTPPELAPGVVEQVKQEGYGHAAALLAAAEGRLF